MDAAPKPHRSGWLHLIPNAITCASLTLGMMAIMLCVDGDPVEGGWLILLCVLLDKLDGTTARLLNATSPIGSQLDSFSDFVTFGIAPPVILFTHIRHIDSPAYIGWTSDPASVGLHVLLIGFTICAVLRLARFNVAADEPADPSKPRVFFGLPTTFAGGLLVVLYLIAVKHHNAEMMRWLPAIGLALGLLMITRWPLPKLGLHRSMVINIIIIANVAMGYICGLFRIWPEYIAISVTLYAVIGFSWGLLHKHELRGAAPSTHPPSA